MPFGRIIAYLYAVILLVYIFFSGIAMQTNSIGLSIHKSFGINNCIIGMGFVFVILYIIFGGAKRIMKVSEYIIPFKVILFFLGIIVLFIYHYKMLLPSLCLVVKSAFQTKAALSGIGVFTMQRAIFSGIPKALNATESGLGTASIFFSSSSRSENPLKSSIMSMVTAFISTNLVCAMLIFSIIVSGVSTEGLTSTAVIIKAFETILAHFLDLLLLFYLLVLD